ncbi:MAG: GIY-YIG nuclease family protein [Nitrospinae bacterium]|nr:GIY-YIG nuclease family protein [Nitrospinota bacterium]
MKKDFIISEIVRTAKGNNGVPLGQARFERATGIKETDWSGKYWINWGEALLDAGYEPNKLQGAYDEDFLIEKLIGLIQKINKFPTLRELKKEAFENNDFPSLSPFTRLGKKHEMAKKVIEYCKNKKTFPDIITISRPISEVSQDAVEHEVEKGNEGFGYVYLMKIGNYHKIGMTYDHERRHKELGRDVPWEKKYIHIIETDDPSGIEAYWHKRFEAKRIKDSKKTHKEYYKLSSEDIKAFKRRRKFM